MFHFRKKKAESEVQQEQPQADSAVQSTSAQKRREAVEQSELGRQYLKLQNGSDIRGVACAGPNGEVPNLTDTAVRYIGMAFAGWLAERTEKPVGELHIGVGRDSRITGVDIAEVFMQGLRLSDAHAVDCGMASTPAMFMSTVYEETNYDGGCMITASHLPYHRNGIKFFTKDGGLEKAEIKELLLNAAILEEEEVLATGTGLPPKPESFELIPLYAEKLCVAICELTGTQTPFKEPIETNPADEAQQTEVKANRIKPLAGLHVVVDAGNGAGGFFVEKILNVLGADTTGSQFLDPDGMFPNHEPNPENKDAMAAIVKATVENQADLGLIFDTDVDRMSAVLSDGTALNRDAIIAMIAAILAPENPGSTIITDSVTSDRLTDFLEGSLGLEHLSFKRGYKNVIDKCKELNAAGTNSPLAMETSGHGCLKENYYLDDGAYLAVRLLAAVSNAKKKGETIDHLIADLSMEYADREVRFPISKEDFGAYGTEVLEDLRKKCEEKGYELPTAYEGVRVRFRGEPTGWFLLRASLHDPVMVLNIEGKTQEDLEAIADVVRELMTEFDGLNQSAL